MPKFLEQDLEAAAAKKGMTGRKAAQYVYGAMNNLGAMHGNQETPKGAAMQAKHNADVKAGTAKPVAPMPKPIPTAVKPAKSGGSHPLKNLGAFAHPKKSGR